VKRVVVDVSRGSHRVPVLGVETSPLDPFVLDLLAVDWWLKVEKHTK
jgi:hypothetical protein